MKIRYTKRKLLSPLFIGILWSVFGIFLLIRNESSHWVYYVWFIIPALYFALFFYESYNQYLTLENGILTRNLLTRASIPLKEIKSIRKSGKHILILESEKQELSIDTKIIAPDSLAVLNKELEKLDV